MTAHDSKPFDTSTLVKLLDQRYGDGSIYMKSSADRKFFLLAVSLGMDSEQGYLTGHGRQFWAQRV